MAVAAGILRRLTVAAIVEPTEPLSVVAADPDDDRVLEAALAFGAALIVSGDRHLLDLGAWREIEILGPARFASRYSR